IDFVGQATHADDLDSFVLRQIASYRAVSHIGLGMHHAGDRAVEPSGDVDHIERVVSRAIVGDSRERANQNQSCQDLIFSIIELTTPCFLFSGPCRWARPWRTRRDRESRASSTPSQTLKPQQVPPPVLKPTPPSQETAGRTGQWSNFVIS